MEKARVGWGKFGFFENNFHSEKDFSVMLRRSKRHRNNAKLL